MTLTSQFIHIPQEIRHQLFDRLKSIWLFAAPVMAVIPLSSLIIVADQPLARSS